MIALRNYIIADHQDKLITTCEIILTKIHFVHKKAIYFASYYIPPNDYTTSLEALHESLSILYLYISVTLAGDLNLPAIDWENLCATNQQKAAKHNKLTEIVGEFGIVNMVSEPPAIDSGNRDRDGPTCRDRRLFTP